MIRFLAVYCSIYLLIHYYTYFTIKRGQIISKSGKVIFWLFAILMISGPIIVRFTEKAGFETGSRLFAYICFSWLGLLFLFVSLTLLVDFLRFWGFLIRYFFPERLPVNLLFARFQVISLIILTVLFYGYGLFEAANIRTVYHQVNSVKIPIDPGRIRVVQVSDIHLGLLTRERKLKKILEKVKAVNPDLLVSTGDFVDGQLNNITAAAKLFAGVKAPLGKYAVLGNHEVYAGLENSIKITEDAGFTVLRNRGEILAQLTIIGVDDQAIRSRSGVKVKREEKLLNSYSNDKYKIFLKHRPSQGAVGPEMFDLQLSGHTHNGQIFPFNLIIRLLFPYPAGELVTANGSIIYVSPGTGTWGPPIRIMAPPEITVIDLVHLDKK